MKTLNKNRIQELSGISEPGEGTRNGESIRQKYSLTMENKLKVRRPNK